MSNLRTGQTPTPPPPPPFPPLPPPITSTFIFRFGCVVAVLAMLGMLLNSSDSSASKPTIAKTAAKPYKPSLPEPPPKPKTKAELKQEAAEQKRQAEEEAKNDEAIRVVMAKTMENTFLGKGFNVDVNAIGPHHTTLRLKWVLVSKVTAYQIAQDDQETLMSLKKAGFKKFTITNGYDESWTWTLNP
jgi:hypothetical protein